MLIRNLVLNSSARAREGVAPECFALNGGEAVEVRFSVTKRVYVPVRLVPGGVYKLQLCVSSPSVGLTTGGANVYNCTYIAGGRPDSVRCVGFWRSDSSSGVAGSLTYPTVFSHSACFATGYLFVHKDCGFFAVNSVYWGCSGVSLGVLATFTFSYGGLEAGEVGLGFTLDLSSAYSGKLVIERVV